MKSTVASPPLWGLCRQAAAVCGILLVAWSGLAGAVGTASSTSITNRSSLTYSVGGVPQTLIESSPTGNSTPGATLGADTSFVVDNKVDVLVTEGNTTFTSVSPGQLAAVTTFTVTNQGNTTQDLALAVADLASGAILFGGTDNFNGTSCSAFRESGATAGYQAAQDTATFVDELTADGTVTVYGVCDIPAGQANGSNAVVSLTATARVGGVAASLGAALTETAGANTAGVDIVFADDTGTDDANRDAAHSARDAYRVVAAALTVTKTVALVCDPLNSITNPKNIPGAIVRWTITVSNAAGAGSSATLTQVSDALNANSTFDPDLVTGAGGAAGCEGAAAGAGTPESANSSGFKLDVAGDTRPGTYPKFFTTANDNDGSDLNGTTVEIDYGPAMPAEGTYTAGELKAGESVTVYFNVSIN
jgi:hypothetical protein